MFPFNTPYQGIPPAPPYFAPEVTMSRAIPGVFPSGSTLPFMSAAQPGALPAVLPSLQKLIGVAQTVTPMVRQYYPLVKQLPSLWRMLSTMQSDSDNSSSSSSLEDTTDESSSASNTNESNTESIQPEYYSTAPPPKLYI